MEFDFLFADGQIPVLQLLGHGVKSTIEIEVDERALAVFQLVKRRRFLELAAQVGELVVAPDLLESEFLALALVPRVVKVQRAGVFTPVLLGLCLFGFEYGLLSGLRGSNFLFRLSSSATGTNTGSWASRSLAA